MNKSFATTLTSTGQFSQHFVSLSSDVEKFGKNLDKGRLKLNEYYNVWNGHTRKTSTLIKDLAKQQVMLEQAIIQPVGKNAQGLMQYNVMVAKGLDEVKNKMALARQEAAIMNKVMLDGATGLINWGKNTQWAGRQLTVGLTVPLVAFGAAAQKAFREADAELVRLTKVYGGLAATSSADLAQVRKDVSATAREIASSYGVAYKDTISLAADLAATGKQGNELLQATQQTTRLAVLGEVDRADAMKATLAIQNAFKQNTDELTQSIDFLNAVENQTSTSLADLTEAIPKAGPVIKALGGDVKDLALYLTAMKEGGVNAAEGANAIKSAMASLINPTKVATELFSGFGIDLRGIVTKDAGDLTQTILDLQSALDQLNPLDKSRAIEQLFGKFQFARMSALFENLGKQGSQTLQVMDLMKASASDLASISERELKLMTESASGQFKRALASVQADLASTGEQFLKISTKVLKVVDAIVKFFQHLPGPVKTFLNVLGGLTAIAGPLIMMAGVMGNFIGYVVKGIFHLRQLAKGGQGFKLLTPEIMAADAAAKGLATSFYSDSEATIVLSNAVNTLAESFINLETKANAAKVSVQPAVSTVAGGVIMAGTPGSGRVVDKDHPLVGSPYSRDMSHLIPSGNPQAGTIFGTVPGAKPVNIRVGRNPQAYMNQDLPKIPGLTSIGGVSTGIVASEAAKWHSMTAAISMQSEEELAILKKEVMATGTITASLSDSYQALLPEFSQITELAAQEVQAIVAEVQANKITVEAARAKIISLNATVEAMLAETAAMTATSMGRTANLTTVPLTSQPVVDPVTGKANMKEMFHKGPTREMVDRIARALAGVRTSGAGYNIETTKPRLNKGGIVPGTGNTDTYHTTAEPGSFVINKAATQKHLPLITNILGSKSYYAQEGGQVPVVLTPGEAVIPASFAQKNMPLMYQLNGGVGNTSGSGMHIRGGLLENKKLALQRTHITEDLSGMALLLPRELNLGVNSNGSGLYGSQIANLIRKTLDAGIDPSSLMNEAAVTLGGDFEQAQRRNSVALQELIAKLESPEYAGKMIGGKGNPFGFEQLAKEIFAPALRGIKIDSSKAGGRRNLYSAISQIFTTRAKEVLTKDDAIRRGLISGSISGSSQKGQIVKRRDGRLTWVSENRTIGSRVPAWARGTNLATLLTTSSGVSHALKIIRRNSGGEISGKFAQRLFNGSPTNQFGIGGLLGNVLKGKAMKRIGAGYGPTGEPKPSTFESAPWGVNSLSIKMAETLFASTGLRKYTQKLFYDKFAAALAKEKPYGYVHMADGTLKRGIEPDALDAVIRSAASDMIGDKFVLKQLSPIDKEILKTKYLNWESRKDTPLTETLKKLIFSLEGRAAGGPVNAGQPYIVGEKGPELFVPRNAGGIVPNNYGIGGQIVAGLGISAIANMIASKITNPLLSMIVQQAGYMLPMMLSPSLGGSTKGIIGRGLTKVGLGKTTTPLAFSNKNPGEMTKFGTALAKAESSGTKFGSMISKVGLGLTRFNLISAVVIGGLLFAKNRWDANTESMRLNALGYGMTEEAAKKAGLRFRDFNKSLKESVETAKAVRQQNQLLYQSMTGSGTPLKITIAEFKKLKKTVKTDFADQIKLIDKTSADDQIALAERLKTMFIGMGMSSEEATKKIYAMYTVSKNFSSSASLYTVSSEGFNKIKTSVDAAAAAIKLYNKTVHEGRDGTEQANAFITANSAILTAIEEQQAEALKKRKKDKTKPTFISTADKNVIMLDAEVAAIEKISKAQRYQKTVSQATLKEMEKTNPVLREIADLHDTNISLMQKQRLIAKGFTLDMRGLSAAQTDQVYRFNIAITKSIESVAKNGFLQKQYKHLDGLKQLQEKYTKAMKGQSVAQQISDRDKLSALQKQIDANNKLADARIKALDAAKKEGDIGREIAKAQARYQAALATGNTADAQQASLDMQGLQSDLQYNAQVKAIEDATTLKNAPLLKQIELIQKKQQDVADAAAYASEKFGDVSKKIDDEESAITKLITAMANYRTAIDAHKDDLAKWKTSPEATSMLAAITEAATAIKVNLTPYPVDPATGKPGVDAATGLMSALETSLIKAGLVVNGDLYINSKKVGGAQVATAGAVADPSNLAGKRTGAGTKNNPYEYSNAAGAKITEKQFMSMPYEQPGSLAEFILPLSGMSNREFINLLQAQMLFLQKNNNKPSYVVGDLIFHHNGSVTRDKAVVGRWFSPLPGGGEKVKSYETGGKVVGPGTGTSDSIPALLSNGEYVIKEKAVRKYGIQHFDNLNAQKFADGGIVNNFLSNQVDTTATSTGESMGGPFGLLGRGMQDLGSLGYEMLQSTINSGKYLAGSAFGKTNWMSAEDEDMYQKAILEYQKGNKAGAYGKIMGRAAMSALNLYPKILPWNKIWAQAGMKDLPGMTEALLANIPSSIPDIYSHYFGKKKRKYAEGGLVPNINRLDIYNPYHESVYKNVGGNDTIDQTKDVLSGKFTDSEKKVSEFMHSWVGLLNTYYGAKYQNLFKMNGKPSLLETPIVTDLEVTDPRNWLSMMGGEPGFSWRDINDPVGTMLYVQPTSTQANLPNIILPDKNNQHLKYQPIPGAKKNFDFKTYSEYINKQILTNDESKMSLLSILNHEFGHSMVTRLKESGIFGNDRISSKLFKDKFGKPLKNEGDGKQYYDMLNEINADLLSGQIMSEMFNAGYMNNIVKSESVTKYLKAHYTKAAPDLSKTNTDIDPHTDDSHPQDSNIRFAAYLQGFKNKNTDIGLADYFGVTPGDLFGDTAKAKAMVADLSNFQLKSNKFDENAQTAMPDLLNTDYAKILGLKISGKPSVKNKALEIRTPHDFGVALITALGGTPTENLLGGIQAWAMQEGGHWQNRALYNPLNTTLEMPGSTKVNTVNAQTGTGVQAYTSWDQGLDAVLQTLKFPNHGYEDIISALTNSKSTDLKEFYSAINKSDWGHPKYTFDINNKLHQRMTKYNPDKPFGTDPNNTNEYYSKLPGQDDGMIILPFNPDKNTDKNTDQPGGNNYDTQEDPWDKPTIPNYWPEGEKFYNPKQTVIDHIEYAYPLIPFKEFNSGTLQTATNQIPKQRTRSGISIAASNGVYNMFKWGGKTWAKAMSSGDEIFELEDFPVTSVAGNKVADATVKNVIDRPYGEPFYYYPNGGIGTTAQKLDLPGTNIPTVFEMLQNTIEKFFLTRNGDTGFKNGKMNRRDTKDFMTFNYNAYPDSILQKFSNGGLAIPKFQTGINNVPANMLAMLHKNEAVIPANMNPFNPNANNATMSGGVYNITNNINGYDGDLEQLSSMVTQKTITAIKTLDARTAKMTGPTMTVGIK
jgi:TP901 family phage tail tape measure protein